MAGIDHQPFKVCVIHQGFQNLFPDSLVTPPAKPAVYILPVSVRFWQVPPRCPGTKDPEYTVDKLPGSRAFPPRVPFSPMVYGLIFSHALSLISCRCCSIAIFLPSFTFEDHYITLLLTTLSRIKTAKSDLFRTCYPADNPAGRQTAREYRKLSGGFFCRFRSKYACILRCRGPPRKSESPSHLDFRRERNAKNSSV